MKIFLVGLLGSGKSFLGRALASEAALPFIDLDEAIEKAEGRTVPEIFSKEGEEYFREIEARVLRTQSKQPQFVMATGGGAPCFHGNMQFMNETGVTVFIDTPVSSIVQRMDKTQKAQRPLLASTPDEQLEALLNSMLSKRITFYSQAKLILNHQSVPELFKKIKSFS
jgi:shikimate kinase